MVRRITLAIALVLLSAISVWGQAASLPDASPQDLSQMRAKLYLGAARESQRKIAPQVYQLALDSELCRINSGAKLCGLSIQPLQDGSFESIYNYYVKQPVEAVLNQQRIQTRKADWTWQPSSKSTSPTPAPAK